MTKKLEELFNLPKDEDSEETPVVEIQEEVSVEEGKEIISLEAMSNLEKIDAALPAIKGLEASDDEMDEIAKAAMESYKDLFDLGMNVEARVANDILNSSATFLGHAITAKNAKISKKLRMVELQLRQAKLELDKQKLEKGKIDDDDGESEGQILDRNELLAQVLEEARRQEGDKKD